MTDTLSIAERVQAGIAVLDEDKPGWRELINLTDLDLCSNERCVIGQVYKNDEHDYWGGNYSLHLHRLAGTDDYTEADEWAIGHGFESALTPGSEGFPIRAEYDALTDAWKAALR